MAANLLYTHRSQQTKKNQLLFKT